MRTLLNIILFTLISTSVIAKCNYWYISVKYPVSDKISNQQLFVLEMGWPLAGLKDSIGTKHEVYLKSENHKVNLKMIKSFENGSITQIHLKPLSNFNYGEHYDLIITNLEPNLYGEQKINYYNSKYDYLTNPRWEATQMELHHNQNELNIHYLENSANPFGTASINAIFIDSYNESVSRLYFVQVFEIQTGKINRFYITSKKGIIRIGKDMCSIRYSYKANCNYKIMFKLINNSGKAISDSEWITFNSPISK